METNSPEPTDSSEAPQASTALTVASAPAQLPAPEREIVVGQPPPKQLAELPRDELENLAEDLGIDSTKYKARQDLVAAVHERRQLIAGMKREALLDVVRWGR